MKSSICGAGGGPGIVFGKKFSLQWLGSGQFMSLAKPPWTLGFEETPNAATTQFTMESAKNAHDKSAVHFREPFFLRYKSKYMDIYVSDCVDEVKESIGAKKGGNYCSAIDKSDCAAPIVGTYSFLHLPLVVVNPALPADTSVIPCGSPILLRYASSLACGASSPYGILFVSDLLLYVNVTRSHTQPIANFAIVPEQGCPSTCFYVAETCYNQECTPGLTCDSATKQCLPSIPGAGNICITSADCGDANTLACINNYCMSTKGPEPPPPPAVPATQRWTTWIPLFLFVASFILLLLSFPVVRWWKARHKKPQFGKRRAQRA